MKAVIQLETFLGQQITDAWWDSEFDIPPGAGHVISLNIPISDVELVNYASKLAIHGIVLDKNDEGYTYTFPCNIKYIKHMFDTTQEKISTIVAIQAYDKTVEQALLYMLDRNKCSFQFVKAVQNLSSST